MGSPFPGMDPYLEDVGAWPGFHYSLSCAIQEDLQPKLPDSCYAIIGCRKEAGPVPNCDGQDCRRDMVRHTFVEIRDVHREHRLITLIEIVSPTNKVAGPDRRAYVAKQKEVVASSANLVEVDLSRGGRRTIPYPDLACVLAGEGDAYAALVNRASRRTGQATDYEVYGFGVRDPLPNIPIPLAGKDPDVVLRLPKVLERVYETGPYSKVIDYGEDPLTPLPPEDAAWADELLRSKGLRKS